MLKHVGVKLTQSSELRGISKYGWTCHLLRHCKEPYECVEAICERCYAEFFNAC